MKTISIITPCFNSKEFIKQTIDSVFNQTLVKKGKIHLEYIICDGGSTDGTLEIIENEFEQINNEFIKVKLISQTDTGMYDALSNGLQLISGEIVAYINADDFYSPHAFEIVDEIFNHKQVKWLTGLGFTYNNKSHVVSVTRSKGFSQRSIKAGLHGQILPFIQQESTFWHRDLLANLDFEKLRNLKLAGDFYLWKHFANQAQLYVVQAWLAGFRIRQGQLSNDLLTYHREIAMIADKASFGDKLNARFENILRILPRKFNKRGFKKRYFIYNYKNETYNTIL